MSKLSSEQKDFWSKARAMTQGRDDQEMRDMLWTYVWIQKRGKGTEKKDKGGGCVLEG